MLARVRRTLRERALVARGDVLLAACSGGPDSVAMVHVLSRLSRAFGITVRVASIDHGLRAEAAREVEAVGRIAAGLGLPFDAVRLRLAAGPSVQAAARHARYDALLALASARGARRVAVGHTRDDQAETVLARILRGAGVDGLVGIDPARSDGVIRPLLDCRRADVRAYVARWGLPVTADPSNGDRRFLRARVRHGLLPLLEAEDPSVTDHLAALAEDARAHRELAEAAGLELLVRAGAGQSDTLEIAGLRGAGRAARRSALRRWAEGAIGTRLGRAHLEAADRLLFAEGEVLLPEGWRLVRHAGALRALR